MKVTASYTPRRLGKTPTSVKKLVEEMAQKIEQQEKKLTEVLTVNAAKRAIRPAVI
ncbi:hypothetical protein ANSO36C_18510 [Nostoc cf. commune SO-36]|uniref:Uncharacterized protein n=1 Tax=Nostoc cf. commune SO-36 TaxID=449208 RepID=A0ABM7YZH6_NOSCO|nr:hypothetical protein [Nostoc commune]BDI16049.1 hypothetical protein ANSO36C_18510 [Nostoc cf. commune SO-36]